MVMQSFMPLVVGVFEKSISKKIPKKASNHIIGVGWSSVRRGNVWHCKARFGIKFNTFQVGFGDVNRGRVLYGKVRQGFN